MRRIDKLDALLLGRLANDARTGVVELASALGVARNTIAARLRKLEDTGLVRGYRPDVDLAAAGLDVQAYIAVELEQSRLQEIINTLTAIPAVLEIHTTTGREDLLVRVATDTHAHLQLVVERVLDTPGVTHSVTTIVLTSPLNYRVQPLLDHFTRDAGWGRSTPPPPPISR